MKYIEKFSGYIRFIRSVKLSTLFKALEIKLLGSHASDLCYSYPDYVIIEVTKRCNLRCKMCYQSSKSFKLEDDNPDMAFADFKKIIDQLTGIRRLWLTGGECFLNNDLFNMISYASNKLHAYIGLTTNGTLVTQEKADKLANSELNHLNVSIDSPNEETFKKIRNTSVARVIKNIRYLNSVAPHINIGINVVVMKDNLNELPDIIEIGKEIGAKEIVYQMVHPLNENVMGQMNVYDNSIIEQIEKDIQNRAKYVGMNYTINKISDSQSFQCIRPFFECFIDYKGRITPCCDVMNVPLTPSLFDHDFKTELNSPAFRKFRKHLLQRKYPGFCQCCWVVNHRASLGQISQSQQ
jgi:MoaA/NifB/PqqE/SkfB family radical SAM enzyme